MSGNENDDVWAGAPRFFSPVNDRERVEVRAKGWNYVIEEEIEPRWPSPLRHWFPEGEEADAMHGWHWLFFQFVFPLDDPRLFPVLDSPSWTSDEVSRLRRYVNHARDLATTAALSTQSRYEVSVPNPDSDWEIEESNKIARDATVGFLTMLRQCYAKDENASFKRAFDLVGREARRAGVSPEFLRAWKGAHNRMRANYLDYLILVRAGEVGLIGRHVAENSGWHPERVNLSPEQMLSTMFYGDSIHWGSQRTVVDSWDQEHEFWAMKRRFDALRLGVQLGHLYVGFAAVVGRALGDLSAGAI